MNADHTERLLEVPAGWENGGEFQIASDGVGLQAVFGESDNAVVRVRFNWVRSFRYVSEAAIENERDRVDVQDALLSELPLPDPKNPSTDYYGSNPDIGKGPPRLFRFYHYKAGLIEVVASDWRVQ